MINDLDYWEKRFSTGDWNAYGGEEQSAFFSRVLCEAMPDWLRVEMSRNAYEVHDYGCAEGAGTAYMAKRFPVCRFTGLDFSTSSIRTATEKHASCQFQVGDLMDELEECDIIISSNTLEHFSNPMPILHKLIKAARRHVILLLPFEDDWDIEEHVVRFSADMFSDCVEGYKLSSFRVLDCRFREDTHWLGKQLLCIYSHPSACPASDYTMARVYEESIRGCLEARAEAELKNQNLQSENGSLVHQQQELQQSLAQAHSKAEQARQESERQLAQARSEAEQARQESELQLAQAHSEAEQARQENERQLAEVCNAAQQTLQNHRSDLEQQVLQLAQLRSFKLAHWLSRTKNQFLHGSHAARKAYIKWLFGHMRGASDTNHSYNPLFTLLQPWNEKQLDIPVRPWNEKQQNIAVQPQNENAMEVAVSSNTPSVLESAIQQYSGRYVCVLLCPVDFEIELFQRPQQIAIALAQMGVLTLFITPNYLDKVQGIREERPNLLLIPNQTPLEGLLACIHRYGKESVVEVYSTDTILPIQRICELQKLADHVVYEYTDEIARKVPLAVSEKHRAILEDDSFYVLSTADKLHEEVKRVRGSQKNCLLSSNGVDIGHFQQPPASMSSLPLELAAVCQKGKPIIGYYGAIATWFDFELLSQAAQARPQYEFVVVGPVFNEQVRQKTQTLNAQPNITVCAPIAYQALPGAAKHFTVATIPFIVNEITESTSPIKLFEYMAMGKPVVTTEMRECHKYPIYVAQNVQEYVAMLDQAIADADDREKQKQLHECALQHSWTACAMDVLHTAYPKLEQRMEWIVLAAIGWDFRFQRPQQLAQNWAQMGDHVTYVNPDLASALQESKRGSVDLVQLEAIPGKPTNIFMFKSEKDAAALFEQLDAYLERHHVRTANVLVQYPTWYGIAQRLHEKYGFRILMDYLDEYDGFTNTNHNPAIAQGMAWLRKSSDIIFATSQYLFDHIGQTNARRCLVRNGTESAHFEKARGGAGSARKVIGYYGAIADWFDQSLVIHAAKALPQYRFDLVGDYSTVDVSEMKKVKNIRLLGEVPYARLTEYLQTFDVCLIPFRASLDLIQATNPVKFYEYLSAGKKIVTTEIRELLPYRDQYVLMSNDPDGFAEAIRKCVSNTDGLASEEQRVAFAKQNDWQERARMMRDEVSKQYPKVSVVVLTWNNARYNIECLRSIFDYSAYPNMEVIVVDNASTDGTPECLRQFASGCSGVRLILNDENRGFAAGMNQGIRVATGEYIVILNNDTLVTPGWLTGMMRHLEDEKIGAVGVMTNNIGNEARLEAGYDAIAMVNDFAVSRSRQRAGKGFDIKVLALFCTMMRRKVMDEIGELDEQFKVGMFEDDDYSLRLQKAGYRTVCAEDVFIHHYGMSGFKQLSQKEYMEIFNANKERYEKKHGLRWQPHHY